MTTTPNPTAAELAAALSNARGAVADEGRPGLSPSTVRDARVLLHIKAQLAESERAREALREAVREYGWCGYCQGDYDGCGLCDKTGLASWSRAALAAENTAEETTVPECPTGSPNCKCTDAAHQALIREMKNQTPEPVEPRDEEPWRSEYELWLNAASLDHTTISAFREGYRAGLAAEAAAHEKARAAWSNQAHEADGQRMQLRAELALVRAELADMESDRITANEARERLIATKNKYINHIGHDDAEANAALTLYNAGINEGYRAGLAAEAAAHEETRKRFSAERKMLCDNARAAGLARDAELERVRGQLLSAEDNATRYYREAGELRAQARARRVPTIQELANELDRAAMGHNRKAWRALDQETLLCLARAAMTALGFQDSPGCRCTHEAGDSLCPRHPTCSECGEPATDPEYLCVKHAQPSPLVTSDNEPPVPLPEVLPAGSRYLRTTLGDLYLRGNGAYADTDGSRVEAREVDWSHYRAQQRAAEPTPGVASPPKHFATPAEALDCISETIAEECHQEHPAHDAIEYLTKAEPTPWKPTVGERAVLVASPDPDDEEFVGQELKILVEDYLENGDPHPGWYWRARDENGDDVSIHRDATWRPASAAPADSPIPTCIHADADHEGPCRYQAASPAKAEAGTCTWAAYAGKSKVGCDQASDHPSGMCDDHRAFAERFGRDVATAEPDPSATSDSAPEQLGHTFKMRVTGGARGYVSGTLPGNAEPAEPSPQPGGFLDALTRRVEALERFRGSMLSFTRQFVVPFDRESFDSALDGVAAVFEREERSKPSVGQSATNRRPTER